MSFWLPCNIRKGFASTRVRRASHASSISPYRCFRCFRHESRRSAARRREIQRNRVVGVRTRLYVSIQNVSGLFRTAASQRRDLPPPEELFFPPFPTVSTPVRARPPHNMWHVRGLVISSELDSSSIQLRVHDPVERTLCARPLWDFGAV